jgi:hypothetical protein
MLQDDRRCLQELPLIVVLDATIGNSFGAACWKVKPASPPTFVSTQV